MPSFARKNILFVCSRNQWRSPTAEQIWYNHPNYSVRSGGTSRSARHVVSVNDIRWADIIWVMEETHKVRLTASFRTLLNSKKVYVLDIPDEYQFMDSELIELLKQSVNGILELP
ncbi:low molecular weight protein tyrosine phosphatase family protein [Aquirhabdus parva]|uniref:Phosphotyrosine protein phosphatase n=1 Tax=Aquirhabdus parva TaxID=2283318 RepID=A0A345P5G2_9GAMM|nr:phosphotyrosine protein phosphatase [Aquirhabdus parva]AXI02521.1 phosphotyrosine protein phosphatase [Aquirhabdus parva]